MSTTIESLELEVLSSSQSAESGLDALTASLEKLKKATSGGVGLTSVIKQIKGLGDAAKSVDSTSINNLSGLTKAISTLSNLGGVKLSSTIATQITAIGDSAKTLNGVNFAPISDLANSLSPLSTIGKINLNSVVNQLNRIPELATKLNSADMSGFAAKIRELVTALQPLSEMPKQTISSTLTQIKKIPEIFAGLQSVDMGAFSAKIQELATALKPLADEMNKVAAGFSAFPAKIQRLIANTNSLTASNNKASSSYINLYAKLKMAWTTVKTIGSTIAGYIVKSSEYTENVNLFNVAIGKYAVEAKKYAEQIEEVMGIDPGDWMRNQGIFMTLATGFGVASDRANVMSKNLTQLGYDISSFYNLSVDDAMQKLESGLAGELEPLRRIGYDLSQAKLEATALSLGIDKSVSSMTQAEKAELRYYAIMTQVTQVQGDMARTLEQPANQIRIFKAQLEMAGRAIGNVFIPALNAILPYAIAVVKVIRVLAEQIALLVGFTLPEVDTSDYVSGAEGADDLSNALDNATESAKTLQKYTMGFDELNVIDPTSGVDDSVLDTGFDFELPEYDFIGDAVNTKVNEIVENMKEWLGISGEINTWADFFDTKLGKILLTVGSIGVGIAAWKVSNKLLKALTTLKTLGSKKFNVSLGLIGATLFMADLDKLKQYLEDFAQNGATFSNVSGMISEFAGLIGDAMILLGNTTTGGAFKTIQGVGEIVSAVADMADTGVDWDNMNTIIRGITNIAIGIGLLTKNLTLTGWAMAIQGFTSVINELATNWEAIKSGDWSGVDKVTLTIGVIEAIGGIVTALGVFSKIKGATDTAKAAKEIKEVADVTETVSTTTSTLTTKLTTLIKDLALGIAIVAEVAAAAALFVGAVWVLGKELEQVAIAWQPVIDNGGTVAIAVGIGTGVLVGIGAATAALGSVGTSLIVNIALGIAMLAEVGASAALFLAEILVVGKLLDEIGQAWQPVLDNGETIAIGIGIGTGILVAVGAAAAGLGVAATATAGALPLAIALGTAMLIELGVAAAAFLVEIKVVGDCLVKVKDAWQPVLDHGETISTGIATGTALLIGVGAVAAALGAASVASVGLLPLAIGIGTAMLVELGVAFVAFTKEIVLVAGEIKDKLDPALSGMVDLLPGLSTNLGSFTLLMVEFAGAVVAYTATNGIASIAATIDKFIDFFTTDPIERLSDEAKEQYNHAKSLVENLTKAIPKIKEATALLDDYNAAMDDFERASGTGGGVIGNIFKNIEIGVKVLLQKGWDALPSWLTNIITQASTTLKKGWSSLPSWLTSLSTSASTTLSKGWSSLPSWLTSITASAKLSLSKGWSSLPSWITDIATSLKIKLPHISIEWVDTGFMGVKYPKFGVSYYAGGGFPDMGQLFVAREAGAELVGNIGGRTAVMNNDQIVESVSAGVYQAVIAALGGNGDEGGDTQIVINLDGEKIYENQQKIARNRGYNLGMGVFSFG